MLLLSINRNSVFNREENETSSDTKEESLNVLKILIDSAHKRIRYLCLMNNLLMKYDSRRKCLVFASNKSKFQKTLIIHNGFVLLIKKQLILTAAMNSLC